MKVKVLIHKKMEPENETSENINPIDELKIELEKIVKEQVAIVLSNMTLGNKDDETLSSDSEVEVPEPQPIVPNPPPKPVIPLTDEGDDIADRFMSVVNELVEYIKKTKVDIPDPLNIIPDSIEENVEDILDDVKNTIVDTVEDILPDDDEKKQVEKNLFKRINKPLTSFLLITPQKLPILHQISQMKIKRMVIANANPINVMDEDQTKEIRELNSTMKNLTSMLEKRCASPVLDIVE